MTGPNRDEAPADVGCRGAKRALVARLKSI